MNSTRSTSQVVRNVCGVEFTDSIPQQRPGLGVGGQGLDPQIAERARQALAHAGYDGVTTVTGDGS